MDINAMIADERRLTADLIESLSPEQLDAPSLCGQWTVRQVAGHLLAAVDSPMSVLLPAIVRSGFRLHRANALLAQRIADRPIAELAAGLRSNADNRFEPPVVGYPGQLTDQQVHGQDMRRPLGIARDLVPERVRISLGFLVGGRAVGFVPKARPAGLRFEATDQDWARGSGPVVRGTGESLMMALTGRAIVLSELDGEGVSVLRARLAGVKP